MAKQVHVIYIFLPKKKTIMLRHEWLFGQAAIKKLKALLSLFINLPQKFSDLLLNNVESMTFFAKMIYSSLGEQSISEVPDPTNNNGVTLIDFSDFKTNQLIKYCLMSTGRLDCHKTQALKFMKEAKFKPLTAETYLKAYYPDPDKEILEQNKQLILFFTNPKIKIMVNADVTKFISERKKDDKINSKGSG